MVLLLGLLFSCSDEQTVMHTVTFNLDGGSFQDGTEETAAVRDGSILERPSDPVKASTDYYRYTFDDWYSDAECTVPFEFSTPITEDITIYAKWDSESNSSNPSIPTTRYTITYTHNYSGTGKLSGIPNESQIAEGSYATKPSPDPVLLDGNKTYVFLGWFEEESSTPFDFTKPITSNKTLEARWSDKSYFDDKGYTIAENDAAALFAWAEAVAEDNDLNCTLNGDINLTSNWTPISTYSGTFDGNGHTISGMTITEATSNNIGFIAQLSGTVKNLGLANVNIDISTDSYANVGAVAAQVTDGTITSCYSSGKISVKITGASKYPCVGGIAGIMSGRNSNIKTSYSTANLSATGDNDNTVYAGGIIGLNQSAGNITECYYSTGTISATSYSSVAYAGGIIGQNQGTSSSITECHSTGTISAVSNNLAAYAGGIIGDARGSGDIIGCYSTGSISASGTEDEAYAGGIAGRTESNITACYFIGTITTDSSKAYAGGISGTNYNDIIACYSTGNVSTKATGNSEYAYTGGISGSTSSIYDSVIKACYSTGSVSSQVSGTSYAGTICGNLTGNCTTEACYWSAKEETSINGIGSSDDTTTQVTGDTTWETAKNEMNTKLTNIDYKYTDNPDKDDSITRPLTLHCN